MVEPYRMEPHSFGVLKGIPSAVCEHCGLVRSHNLLTKFAIQHGCDWDNHPRFIWARSELVKQWQQR